MLATVASGAAALVVLAACPPASTLAPAWNRSRVDFGAGQIVVGLRVRWVAVSHSQGALVKTPEGGRALLRVFNCAHGSKHVRDAVRRQLRDRLLSSEFVRRGRVFAFRWRDKKPPRLIRWTAVKRHGPLVLAVSSETIPLDDVIEITRRVQLVVPVPFIRSCLPLCVEGGDCKPQTSEDEG